MATQKCPPFPVEEAHRRRLRPPVCPAKWPQVPETLEKSHMNTALARSAVWVLLIGVLLCGSAALAQTPALVQSAAALGTDATSVAVPFSSANTAGNLIVAAVRMATTTQTVSVTDTLGNAYSSAVSHAQSSDGHQILILYAMNIQAGSNTVTATFSASNARSWVAVFEYSGLGTAVALDRTAHAQGNSRNPNSGATSTTTAARELVFAALGLPYNYSGTVTAGTSYTLLLQDTTTSRAATEARSVTATGAYSGTFTLSANANWSAAVATFATAPVVTTATLPAATLGAAYSTTLAASGGRTPYTWAVNEGLLPDGLTLNASTGAITGTPTAPGVFSFTVQVTDANANTGTKALSVTVTAPLVITTTSLPDGTRSSPYSAAVEAAGGAPPYTWSLSAGSLPYGLSLNASTGAISGTPVMTGTSNFTVRVRDANTTTKALSITINAAVPLSITTVSLPNGAQDSAYSAALAAAGGLAPYTWSLSQGALPAGLTLEPGSGAITGTPTTPGTSNFTARVTDANSATATKALNITVNLPVSVATASLPNGAQGSAYSAMLEPGGGTAPYTWAITEGSLPAGLSLNASTGAITGTPTGGTEVVTFTVRVTDGGAKTASRQLSIRIVILTIGTVSLPNGALNRPYSVALQAVGGTAPYTWSIAAGVLPEGLSLNPSTGTIAGTPTVAGTSTFTVQLADAASNQARQTYAVTVIVPVERVSASPACANSDPSLAVLTCPVSDIEGNLVVCAVSTAANIAVSSITDNASPPNAYYAFNLFGYGSGPRVELWMNRSDAAAASNLTVTLAAPAPFTVACETFRAVSGWGNWKNNSSTSSANPNVSVTVPGSNSYVVAGFSANGAATFTGADSTATTTGATPIGGAIASLPATMPGPVVVSTTLSAAEQWVAAANELTGMASPPPPVLSISTVTLPKASQGMPYSTTVQAGAGTAPYTWSVTDGTLPDGLSLDPATGAITGTPTATGANDFTVQARDVNWQTASRALGITVAAPASQRIANTFACANDNAGLNTLSCGMGSIAGNLVACIVAAAGDATVTSIADDGGNPYTAYGWFPWPGGPSMELWLSSFSAQPATTLTVTLSTAAQFVVTCDAAAGISGWTSAYNWAYGQSTPPDPSLTVTTQNDNDWVFAGFAAQGPTTFSGVDIAAAAPGVAGAVSSAASGTAGPVTLTAPLSASQRWAATGLALRTAPAPRISQITPPRAEPGASLTITGSNFLGEQGSSLVTLNGVPVAPTSWSNSSIVIPAPAGAGPFNVVVTVAGLASNSMAWPIVPQVTGLSPVFGPVGSNVTIAGLGFEGGGTVTFNGVAATPTSWGSMTVTTTVPDGATSGPVVITSGGVASNGFTFTVSPGVATVSPNSGSAGTPITITGTGFGASQGDSRVTFNGVAATPSSWSGTSIQAPVPASATSGPVVVVVGSASSNGVPFTVSPSIDSLTPTSGIAGTVVTIAGSNFGLPGTGGTITFNGVAAIPTSWGPKRIVVPVPAGASTGPVVVTTSSLASNGLTFTVGAGILAGTITRAGDSSPVSGATVEALQAGAVRASATSASDGLYNIPDLAPGAYDVRVSAASYGSVIQAGNTVTANGTTTVNVSLGEPGGISGTITESDGTTPIEGATVAARQTAGIVGSATTNSAGAYTIPALSAGSYAVEASATGHNPQTQTGVAVTAGTPATVNLSLPAQAVITYEYDEASRLSRVTDSTQGSATYAYDAVGNILSISRSEPSAPMKSAPAAKAAAKSHAPAIGGFAPTIVNIGDPVTIDGANFDLSAPNDVVRMNRGLATVVSAAATKISTSVPATATSGRITLATPGGRTVSAADLFVLPPGYAPASVAFTGRISVGGAFTGTLDATRRLGLLVFDGLGGQKVSVQATGAAAGAAKLAIQTPSGSVLARGKDVAAMTLPADGTYTIIVTGEGGPPGSLTLRVEEPGR
jgi:YD repeat-containing protein